MYLRSGFSNNNKINLGQEKQIKTALAGHKANWPKAEGKTHYAYRLTTTTTTSNDQHGDNDKDGDSNVWGQTAATCRQTVRQIVRQVPS